MGQELAKRLAADGHEVIFITSGFPKAEPEETVDGYKIIRLGNRFTVYWQAYRYYKKHLQGWADLVIDEINTTPFFAKFYVKERNIILIYQLCREIWFYEIFFPLSLVGYVLEPLYLWLLSDRSVLTESPSTKNDLLNFGFKKDKISIFNIGINLPAVSRSAVSKFDKPTVLYFGSLRRMKRPDHVWRAFKIAKKSVPDLQLILAGKTSGYYGRRLLAKVSHSDLRASVRVVTEISPEDKAELMTKSNLLCVTSVKEGWGLVVTEAAACGTPAVVYNVDGLRDSVKDGETGLVCQKNNPKEMASKIVEFLADKDRMDKLASRGLELSRGLTLSNSYQQFKRFVGI